MIPPLISRGDHALLPVYEYLPHMYDLLDRMPDDGNHTLAAFQAWAGLERQADNFTPREDGYASKCDLCFDVRRALQGTDVFGELRPASLYT